ncbi:MAG: hypothetical protein AAB649_00850 [Patescibacteria group bacterium]
MAEEQSYISWAMRMLFIVHAAIAVFTCFIFMVINLMLLKSFRDIWFVWLWIVWAALLFGHYKTLVFFRSEQWKSFRDDAMQKIQEKIG